MFNQANQQPPQLNAKLSLKDTGEISCDECKSLTFSEAVILRKVSRLLTGQTKDSVLPIPTFVCTACGHVNDEFMPEELRSPKLVS
jgi:uncharacterized Zn finger protein